MVSNQIHPRRSSAHKAYRPTKSWLEFEFKVKPSQLVTRLIIGTGIIMSSEAIPEATK